MGVVHSLERNTGVIAVEVAVLNEIFDGINYLFEQLVSGKSFADYLANLFQQLSLL